MKLALLLTLVALTYTFPVDDNKEEGEDPIVPKPQVETRSPFAALEEVRLLANGLLQLGQSLRDFVQKTKGQINDIFHKLNIFDKSFYQLSVLTSEIKEEEEELKKTTGALKAKNEEIKSLSLEISSKVEDLMQERSQLKMKVGGLEEKLSDLSQGLLTPDQAAEISGLKEVIHAQERSITDLLKAVREQNEQLVYQRNKIKSLEDKLSYDSFQDTGVKFGWDVSVYNVSGFLSNYSSDDSLSNGLPVDCGEVFTKGKTVSGVYAIQPNQSEPFLVYCDFTKDGAFTVIQRRQDGSVDFNQSWENYENGFGDFQSEFWLGLKKIHSISRQAGESRLQIQTEDWKQEKKFKEHQYVLEGPDSNYTIHLSDGSGDQARVIYTQAGIPFSTKDCNHRINEPNCIQDYTGGWWFGECGEINLNGRVIMRRSGGRGGRRKGIHWKSGGRANTRTLRSTQISIYHGA
ncbi:angiopoietin-related protein 3 isoform X1 [Chanos chanos]|uniref:Angiopoietin-related protein 3 isoform X1 n=1 Tax=Chanos chanos TaxID=29144 RepID=A0A6J2VG83_CHACN|nr:angiopoietin-related protein 3-like isoform X1 [Chanos chanos]